MLWLVTADAYKYFSSEKIYSPSTHTFEKVPILKEAPPGFFSLQNPAKANLTLVLLAMISKVNFGFVSQDISKFNIGFVAKISKVNFGIA